MMTNWYTRVSKDISLIPECINYYQTEYQQARKECSIWGNLEKASASMPGVVEHRFNQLQERIAPKGKGDFFVRIRDLRSGDYIFFRGFVTGITENVSPSFTPTNYIGRSEPVYTYERAERDISFNLRVYPYNSTEQEAIYGKLNRLTSLAYPEYLPEADNSLVRMKAPFTELFMAHIGTKSQGQFGFIKSLSYTVNENGDWDMKSMLPRLFDIAISYQILNRKPPSMGDQFYRAST